MKNEYKIDGDTVIIYVKCKDKTLECLIDIDDFDLVSSVEGSWCGAMDKGGKLGAVVCFGRTSNGVKSPDIKLHRLITQCPNNKLVDHRDRNPLNNKRSNLKICSVGENSQNRGIGKNNTSGCRGVTQCSITGKWVARVQVNKRRKTLGRFDDIKDAIECVTSYRIKNTTSID